MAFAAAALDPALVEPLGLVAKTLAAGAIVDALVAAVSPPPLPLAGVPVSLSAPDEYSALAVAVAFVAAVASATNSAAASSAVLSQVQLGGRTKLVALKPDNCLAEMMNPDSMMNPDTMMNVLKQSFPKEFAQLFAK